MLVKLRYFMHYFPCVKVFKNIFENIFQVIKTTSKNAPEARRASL